MIDVWNRVLTNVRTAVVDKCRNISSSETSLPGSFPAVYVSQYGDADAAMDLENSENGVNSDIRTQAYSSKSLAEARLVMDDICDAMRVMGYRRTFGPREIENVRDRNVKRVEARFRRFVGSGDEIPVFGDDWRDSLS